MDHTAPYPPYLTRLGRLSIYSLSLKQSPFFLAKKNYAKNFSLFLYDSATLATGRNYTFVANFHQKPLFSMCHMYIIQLSSFCPGKAWDPNLKKIRKFLGVAPRRMGAVNRIGSCTAGHRNASARWMMCCGKC